MRVPAVERKSQLIAATVELMRREGVQSVTMRAIAKEANAPLATAHYCFSNKDELMDAAAEAWLRNLNRFASDVPVHLGLRRAVEQVAEGYWRSLEEEPASLLAEIELIMWATRNADSSPLAAKIYPAYEVELGTMLTAVADSSDDRCVMSIPDLVRCFLMIFDGAAMQYMTDPDAADHRGLFLLMVDALLVKAGL
ncbi:TetR/AcrR family transcriptional regulator [Cryobacterium sp. TMT1-3]|uniref:TetR/AcrR family transcriptional regulator n=1 Tax=Cryobacterium luteum TaxID=1424661 RepID=A0A1H8LGY6_9MICO|nr:MULTISPECIES: TetR family transcriptional regulator [Cryobacterium]TFB91315.1 TetR/AcrR family transcriptional regulator [Cryobacterium luteum]TFC29362.1 TetR/AcrR family transcriptional regulator [Cryobacterium sp. TMT1-3]SEO04414.1 transcriptional regulator, TetR family [Cryobacterium luteum]